MCLNKDSFDLLLISFVFYTHNTLEKQTENSGILLNWLWSSCSLSDFVDIDFFKILKAFPPFPSPALPFEPISLHTTKKIPLLVYEMLNFWGTEGLKYKNNTAKYGKQFTKLDLLLMLAELLGIFLIIIFVWKRQTCNLTITSRWGKFYPNTHP